MRRVFLGFAALLVLGACFAEPTWAPEADVQRLAYADGGTSSVTLYTVIRTSTNEGGHSAVMIDGSQRVIWDPAGTWWHPQSPERNDVHYGITPWMDAYYRDYHIRDDYHVIAQRVEVSQAEADALIAAYQAHGAVAQANCTRTTASVLRQSPSFGSIEQTWFPKRLMGDFGELPGVQTTRHMTDELDLTGLDVIGREDL